MTGRQAGWQGAGGDAHLALTPEHLERAREEYGSARNARQSLDTMMGPLPHEIDPQHGGALAGMEHSLKDEESFLRKVAGDVHKNVPVDRSIAGGPTGTPNKTSFVNTVGPRV